VPRLTALLLVLAACAPAQQTVTGYRDPAVPMFSAALLDPARLVGDWAEAAAFGAASCGPGGVRIAPDLTVSGNLCRGGATRPVAGRLRAIGPGRFALDGSGDWWVVWVDTGYRTLAVGTPAGDWGMVLNRDGALPADRLAAAAEILDFNGYRAGGLARLP
jgi:apolipoprotein D and lipocalin family protein